MNFCACGGTKPLAFLSHIRFWPEHEHEHPDPPIPSCRQLAVGRFGKFDIRTMLVLSDQIGHAVHGAASMQCTVIVKSMFSNPGRVANPAAWYPHAKEKKTVFDRVIHDPLEHRVEFDTPCPWMTIRKFRPAREKRSRSERYQSSFSILESSQLHNVVSSRKNPNVTA